jgi:hypothetical protein
MILSAGSAISFRKNVGKKPPTVSRMDHPPNDPQGLSRKLAAAGHADGASSIYQTVKLWPGPESNHSFFAREYANLKFDDTI